MQNINVTSHNIANANTAGYTRQRLVTSARETGAAAYLIRPTSASAVGQGVEVLDTQQIRSEYLDNQYRDLNTGFNYNQYRTQSLQYLESLFNSELDEGAGLTGSIEEFFNALNDFTSDTTSEENRIAVQQTAEGMTESFNLLYEEMEALWRDQNESVDLTAQGINSIAQKITALNEAIAHYERGGFTANDLRDERNLLLDQLAGYVNVEHSVNEINPSMMDISIGGVELVNGTKANQIQVTSLSSQIDSLTKSIAEINSAIKLTVEAGGSATAQQLSDLQDLNTQLTAIIPVSSGTNEFGGLDVTYMGNSLVSGTAVTKVETAVRHNLDEWVRLNTNTLTLDGQELSAQSGTITGGELYAHMEMTQTGDLNSPGIPYYMNQMNTLARNIAKNINDIHLQGYSFDTDKSMAVSTSENNIYFFDVGTDKDALGNITAEHYENVTAGNFSLSSMISANIWNIAGSSEKVYSDGQTMDSGNSVIAQKLYNDLGISKYYSELNSIVGHLAITVDTSRSLLDTKQSLLNSVDTQRTSISGVSIDEETTNLINFQQTYKACARVINTIDEMIEELISLV
jgi:flagellar hook-associated protein 1 FlgK